MHDNATTIDLQQFISSNVMHSMAPTPAIVSSIDPTIPDTNSVKNIPLEVPDEVRYTFDVSNQETEPYGIGSGTSTTSTTAVQTIKQPFESQIRLPSIGKCTDRLEGTSELSNQNVKQEPEHVILKIEQELDNLRNDDYPTADSDDGNDDDGHAAEEDDTELNDADVIDEIDIENERFNGFPKVIIKDAKLAIRGKQLVELMSRFYRLECDLCEDAK